MSDFTIRPMQPSDAGFIYKAWLEGYWPHFPGNVIISKSEFMQRWHGVVEKILADPQTRTVVAHVEGQPDMLLGFACDGASCLHWAYVKQAFRKMGIGRGLTAGCFNVCSHFAPWLNEHDFVYDPEPLRRYA